MKPFDQQAAEQAARAAGMRCYPFELRALGDHAGEFHGKQSSADRKIICVANDGPRSQALTYVHEACHWIASEYSIDHDESGAAHNRHFGLLVAVCYRRMGKLNRLFLYEFGDTHDYYNGKPRFPGAQAISHDEIIERLRYILDESERYAASSLTIEQIAQDIAAREHAAQLGEKPFWRLSAKTRALMRDMLRSASYAAIFGLGVGLARWWSGMGL